MRSYAILGCGYVGLAQLRLWRHNGSGAIAVSTTTPSRLPGLQQEADRALLVQGDDPIALQELLAGAELLVVSVAPKRGASYRDCYLATAEQLCRLLVEKGPGPLRQLIYTSSTSVYGDANGGWVDEEETLAPTSENEKLLGRVEELYLALASQLPIVTTILRLAGIYGPGREHADRCQQMAGRSFPGRPTDFGNWVHLEDISRAIDWVARRQLGGIYNVCSDDHPTKAELYLPLAHQRGVEPPHWDGSRPTAHKRVSNRKLLATGFAFSHTALQ